jgi:hypothetical protein
LEDDVNQDFVDRLLKQVEVSATMASIARAEALALTSICGGLMAEVARLSPDPQAAINRLAGMLTGSSEKALSKFGTHEVATAQTELLDRVIGIAETALGKPYEPGSRNG